MDTPRGIILHSDAAPQGEFVAPAPSPFLCYMASLPNPGSRMTQGNTLRNLCRRVWGGEAHLFAWHELRLPELFALRRWLAEQYAPGTCNRTLSAVRRVLYFAYRLGLLSERDFACLADLKDVSGSRLTPGRALGTDELRQLFAVLDPHRPIDARDAALVALLYGAGLRCSEATAVDFEEYHRGTGTIRVHGKGNKERLAHLPRSARNAVEAWIVHRGDAPGALLSPSYHGGVIRHGQRMSPRAVRDAVARLGQRAGLKKFSPHDLRRTFISDLLDRGADVVTVQRMAGHASPTMTARYDRRPEAGRARAAELLTVPAMRSGRKSAKPERGWSRVERAPQSAPTRRRRRARNDTTPAGRE